MAASTRQTILTALNTALGTIKTTNGYNTNAGNTVLEWGSDLDVTDLPAISWRDLSSEIEHDGVSFNRQRHMLTVEIQFFASAATSPTTARSILQDIVACLWTNKTWSGLARWTSVDEHELLVDHEDNKITGGKVTCVIEYDTDLGLI